MYNLPWDDHVKFLELFHMGESVPIRGLLLLVVRGNDINFRREVMAQFFKSNPSIEDLDSALGYLTACRSQAGKLEKIQITYWIEQVCEAMLNLTPKSDYLINILRETKLFVEEVVKNLHSSQPTVSELLSALSEMQNHWKNANTYRPNGCASEQDIIRSQIYDLWSLLDNSHSSLGMAELSRLAENITCLAAFAAYKMLEISKSDKTIEIVRQYLSDEDIVSKINLSLMTTNVS